MTTTSEVTAPSTGTSLRTRSDPKYSPARRAAPRAPAGTDVRGKPAAARSSSIAANSASMSGASSRIATARLASSPWSGWTSSPARPASTAERSRWTSGSTALSPSFRPNMSGSLIARPPQLLDHAVKPRAGVRLARADDARDLAVGQARKELERNELALARRQLRHRAAKRRTAQRHIGRLVRPGLVGIGLDGHLGDPRAPAQLVERRVARDAEQPRAWRPSP